MLRPLERLTWPSPFNVRVHCFSGASFASVVKRCVAFSPIYDAVVVHAGVNDASRGVASLENVFCSSGGAACAALRARFPGARLALSLACLSASQALNPAIAVVNRVLRDLSLACDFTVISNDNVRFTDLMDVVHLNAAGTARVHGNILNFLRVDVA